MLNLIKNIMKIAVLFFSLYICSFSIMHIFSLMGITFSNISNTTFGATLGSTIVLFLLHFINKKRKAKKANSN